MNKTELLPSLKAIRAERDDPTREWWLADSGRHLTHRGHRLDFDRNPFQVAILQDQARELIVKKSTQCGVSEIMACWAFGCADRGLSVFWVFPDQPLRNKFVHERIDPVIVASPYYTAMAKAGRERVKGGKDAADSVSMKQLGSAAIDLVGSNALAAFTSFVADAVLIDEFDQCDQKNLARAPDRFGFSEHRLYRRVGNPTISGFGIDALYRDSDQKRWHIRCESCGERQELDWFTNVVREAEEQQYELRGTEDVPVVCRKCTKCLDRHAVGEWVPEYPERDLSGYHVSQLFSGTVTIAEMWNAFNEGLRNETKMQRFHNSVLGLTRESRGQKLSHALLDQCVGDYPRQSISKGGYGGCDVGSVLNVIIITPDDRVIHIDIEQGVEAFTTLDNVMAQHEPELFVIDAMPETRAARMFAERHLGQVLMCWYTDGKNIEDFDVDYVTSEVKCDRTQTMDESHAAIVRGDVKLPRDAASIEDFYDHMCAPTRILQERLLQSGVIVKRFVWAEGSQPDHYRHAFNYAWLARSIRTRHGSGVVVL